MGEPAGGQRRHFLLQAQRKKKPISLKFRTPIDGNKRATGVEQQTFVCFSQLLFWFVRGESWSWGEKTQLCLVLVVLTFTPQEYNQESQISDSCIKES